MFGAMLSSLLPDGFDMEKEIENVRAFMNNVRVIAETCTRIEQKIDSEVVALRHEVAELRTPHGEQTLNPSSGESNDHGSDGNGTGPGSNAGFEHGSIGG